MKKFPDITYSRPDLVQFEQNHSKQLSELENATSLEQAIQLVIDINSNRRILDSNFEVVSIRHSIDTSDKFYDDEQNYYDSVSPNLQFLRYKFYVVLVNSTFKDGLSSHFGKQLFDLADCRIKSFNESILEELRIENTLSTQYQKLLSKASLEFRGQKLNLSGLTPFEQSLDRQTRIDAGVVKWGYYSDNKEEFDRIYDELVNTRTSIAKKLGFESFVEVGYARMQRTEYTHKEVEEFRNNIVKHVVPVVQKIVAKQAKRLGLDSLVYTDELLHFSKGNPTPKGTPDQIVDSATIMYKEMSPETDEFFTFMKEYQLMDLVNKPAKAPGGYCTILSDVGAPFIFSNFNGTAHDVDVLTHEIGHAFQAFSSRNHKVPEYFFPTSEACEIHSMSMEFFAWNWIESFFKEDAEKYYYDHLSNALRFLPYGSAVDEFQHRVYENPTMTPDQRHAIWKGLEEKYLPHRTYRDNQYLEEGGFWQRQAHIYQSPFYYIDYVLAQFCALQFWIKSQNPSTKDSAWKQYVKLCQAGGSLPFLELVKLAGLDSPFEESTIKAVVAEAERWIDSIDDSKL